MQGFKRSFDEKCIFCYVQKFFLKISALNWLTSIASVVIRFSRSILYSDWNSVSSRLVTEMIRMWQSNTKTTFRNKIFLKEKNNKKENRFVNIKLNKRFPFFDFCLIAFDIVPSHC